VTRSGCAGQYSACFQDESIDEGWDFEVIKNDKGGACAGVTRFEDKFLIKAQPCDKKLFLGCQFTKDTYFGAQSEVRKKFYLLFPSTKLKLFHYFHCFHIR